MKLKQCSVNVQPHQALIVLALSCVSLVHGAELSHTTVLDNLDNPCGIAVQPETGTVFVAVSGAGKVIRLIDGQPQEVIVEFPSDTYGEGPKYKIGPLGLAFIDKDTLVVGGGGLPDGEEIVRIYKLPAAGAEPLKADAMVRLGPLAAEDKIPGEGNFYAVVAAKTAILATSNGDDEKGWIAKADIKSPGEYGELTRFVATKTAVKTNAPVAMTLSPREEIVVGQMGTIKDAQDSLLSFYKLADGSLLLNLPTGLFDITGLAYGAAKGNAKKSHLYAIDFAWMDASKGGLFRLDAAEDDKGKQSIKPLRLATLDKPTAMAFDKDGGLLVTVFGTAQEGDEKKPGKLIRFEPGL